jgi:preprotein translocase subunit SecF
MDDFFGNKYKKYLLVPIILLIPMLFLIFIFPGVSPGTDLTGGNLIILRSSQALEQEKIELLLQEEFDLPELEVSTIASPTGYGAWIEYSKEEKVVQAEELLSLAESNLENPEESISYSKEMIALLGGEEKEYNNEKLALLDAQEVLSNYKEEFADNLEEILVNGLDLGEDAEFQRKEVSATIGAASFQGLIQISIIGFIFIILVIFIAFRQTVPSVAIIQAMIFDILAGLAGMALLNIPLSLTTMPALLLLVGYSVDTDIMLTSRLLKEKSGTAGERATVSMKTGLTMTGTTIAALLAMIIISYLYQIEIIYHISAILLFGLIGDVIATWLMNAPILLWFVEKKK